MHIGLPNLLGASAIRSPPTSRLDKPQHLSPIAINRQTSVAPCGSKGQVAASSCMAPS